MDDRALNSTLCQVLNRHPIQDESGSTKFYGLELSIAGSLEPSFCPKNALPSLLKDVLGFTNFKILLGKALALIIPAVPSVLWIKNARRFDPSRIIMSLPDELELTEEYKDCLVRLRRMGMRFAVSMAGLGELAKHEDLISCIDYYFMDNQRAGEYYNKFVELKKQRAEIKSIGFKLQKSLYSFSKLEAHNFDYVEGLVSQDILRFEDKRPKYQHEMLRTFAMLYSSLYDVKQIGTLVAGYPLMSAAMKSMMSSKNLAMLTARRSGPKFTETTGLTQSDLRNFITIALGFNLFSLSEKALSDQNKTSFDINSVCYEPFIQALYFGKIVDYVAQPLCDDIDAPQAFMTGFFRYVHCFLHDSEQNAYKEFQLDAVSPCYKNLGGQLGAIIRVTYALLEHRTEEALAEAKLAGFSIPREEFLIYVNQALAWTDVVCRTIGLIKDKSK